MLSYGEQIKEARRNMGLTLMEAADEIKKRYDVRLTYSYLSLIENDQKTNLTTDLKKAIDNFFDLSEEKRLDAVYSPEEIKILHRAGKSEKDRKKMMKFIKDFLFDEN